MLRLGMYPLNDHGMVEYFCSTHASRLRDDGLVDVRSFSMILLREVFDAEDGSGPPSAPAAKEIGQRGR